MDTQSSMALLRLPATYIGLTLRFHANGSIIFEQRGDNQDGSVLPQQFKVGEQVCLNSLTAPIAVIQSTSIEMTEQPSLTSAPHTIHKRWYTVELLAAKDRFVQISEETLLNNNTRPQIRFDFKPVAEAITSA